MSLTFYLLSPFFVLHLSTVLMVFGGGFFSGLPYTLRIHAFFSSTFPSGFADYFILHTLSLSLSLSLPPHQQKAPSSPNVTRRYTLRTVLMLRYTLKALCGVTAATAPRPPLPVYTPRRRLQTTDLDLLLPKVLQQRNAPKRKPSIIASDAEGYMYLKRNFWERLAASGDWSTMHSFRYEEYTDVRRAVIDVVQKLRHVGAAKEKTYLLALTLANRLNYRTDMVEKIVKMAEEDNIKITPEMHFEIIRSVKGIYGGVQGLVVALRAFNASNAVLTPKLFFGIISAAKSWLPPIVTLEIFMNLSERLERKDINFELLLDLCDPGSEVVLDAIKSNGTLFTKHYVGMLNSCVSRGDCDEAEKIFNMIPTSMRTHIVYERLLSCYKEASCEEGITSVFSRLQHHGMPITEPLVSRLAEYHALQGDTKAVQHIFVAFPQFQEGWALHHSLLSAFAISGETELAELVVDARPSWHNTKKLSMASLLKLRDSYEAKLLAQTGLAGLMRTIQQTHPERSPLSYSRLYMMIKICEINGGFGINAIRKILLRQRNTYHTVEKQSRDIRSALGDIHAVSLDLAMIQCAVVNNKHTFLTTMLEETQADNQKVLPHLLRGILALKAKTPSLRLPKGFLNKDSLCMCRYLSLNRVEEGEEETEREKAGEDWGGGGGGGGSELEDTGIVGGGGGGGGGVGGVSAKLAGLIDEALSEVERLSTPPNPQNTLGKVIEKMLDEALKENPNISKEIQ